MTHVRRCALLAIVLAVLSQTPATFAWNSHGHMLVAAVAYQLLTPTVRARADTLIKLNPFLPKWKALIPASVPAKDRPAALFAIAATWPDEIKQATGYSDDGTDHGERPAGPTSAQNIGYADKLHHKYWHFVDQPFATDGTPLPPIPTPNAEERIVLFRTTLASTTASDALKSYDLVWLLHLVGDIHQPLHAATRVSATQRNGDSGGNFVALCAKPCKDELHAFWDGALGISQSPAAVIKAAKALTAPAPATVNDLDPTHWAADSLALAKADVYVAPIGVGAGPFTATPVYQKAAAGLAARQVALAGARLAAILNANLK